MTKKGYKGMETINEINSKARAAGMSYGKYIAYMSAQAAAQARQIAAAERKKAAENAAKKKKKKEKAAAVKQIIVPEKLKKAQIERR